MGGRERVEQELRKSLSKTEWLWLVKQLQGMLSAIELLEARAPTALQYFEQAIRGAAAGMPEQAREAFELLVQELAEHDGPQFTAAPPKPERLLRLVKT